MKRLSGLLALALSCAAFGSARAEISDQVVRIGVLNDISGIFQDTNGMGSVEAARMAAEDFNGGGENLKVGDASAPTIEPGRRRLGHRAPNELDVARRRRGGDVPNRPSALVVDFAAARLPDDVSGVFHRKLRSDRQGLFAEHHPVGDDAWATGNATAAAMMQRGGTDWYFLTVNYALGQGIEAEATNYIEKHGGKVLGSSKHPLGT